MGFIQGARAPLARARARTISADEPHCVAAWAAAWLIMALGVGGISIPCDAAPFYVALDGSDTNPGTLVAPWRTVDASLSKLLAGDTLYIRAGTYFERPVAAVSGTAASPIVVRSYPGEQVTIDSGYPKFQTIGNLEWELVDAAIGEYRSTRTYSGGTVYGYVAGVIGYENERVALVPYQSSSHFRATTDQYDTSGFYVGPGTFFDSDSRIHVRLAKTTDLRAAEARYGTVFATENADPANYSILLSTASHTLRVNGSYLTFKDLKVNQALSAIKLGANSHHLRFEGITAWTGDRAIEAAEANIHDVVVTLSRIYGDDPYWVFWSDMKNAPFPADRLRGTSIDLRGGAHDWEISYNHIRGAGQDLIGTNTSEYNIRIHHNRIENAGDDALELEGTLDVGSIEVYENYFLNCLTTVAPGQDTPTFTGPLLVYRNVMCSLRNAPVNRKEGINDWNGGKRFGYEYMLKQNGVGYGTKNVHYYHNTMIMLNTAGRGINLTPRDPSDTRIANNVLVMVNGVVNGLYLTGPGQVVDGNLYWKMNSIDAAPLLSTFDDVAAFSAATGLEAHGVGGVPKRGTNPAFAGFNLQVVDPSRAVWELTPDSEKFDITAFFLGIGSPARDAGIVIPSHPSLGALPDTRFSRDIGAIPYGTPASDYGYFPFSPTAGPPVNRAPIVDAGPDQAITLPASATLHGAVSEDGLPNSPAAIAWNQGSGPGTVTFSSSNTLDTQASFSVAGSYVLRLTADDNALDTTDSLSVTVNPPPTDQVLSARVVPNPLRGRGRFEFATPRTGPVRIELFDPRGRRVRVLLDEASIPAGRHTVQLDGGGENRNRLRASVYFYRLRAVGGTVTGRFLVLE